jgi:hypothetical protein
MTAKTPLGYHDPVGATGKPALDATVTKRQEELAGTDGEQSFGKVFSEEARCVVVIYRTGWGETPYVVRSLGKNPRLLLKLMRDALRTNYKASIPRIDSPAQFASANANNGQ